MPIGPREKLLDSEFSKFIRLRAMSRVHGCERCGEGKVSYKELDCCHYKPRAYRRLRWDEDNCAGLCGGCHQHIDNYSKAKEGFFKTLLGETRFALLDADRGTPDVEMLIIYYREKIKDLGDWYEADI
jgi:hypothetical protein